MRAARCWHPEQGVTPVAVVTRFTTSPSPTGSETMKRGSRTRCLGAAASVSGWPPTSRGAAPASLMHSPLRYVGLVDAQVQVDPIRPSRGVDERPEHCARRCDRRPRMARAVGRTVGAYASAGSSRASPRRVLRRALELLPQWRRPLASTGLSAASLSWPRRAPRTRGERRPTRPFQPRRRARHRPHADGERRDRVDLGHATSS